MSLHAGQRVRYWRELRGITQLDLANQAEIGVSRLCRIEKGQTPAKADEIERVVAALELTMGEFYGENEAAAS